MAFYTHTHTWKDENEASGYLSPYASVTKCRTAVVSGCSSSYIQQLCNHFTLHIFSSPIIAINMDSAHHSLKKCEDLVMRTVWLLLPVQTVWKSICLNIVVLEFCELLDHIEAPIFFKRTLCYIMLVFCIQHLNVIKVHKIARQNCPKFKVLCRILYVFLR